jgi:hypothetical protein
MMSQIKIQDLEFCQTESSHNHTIKGQRRTRAALNDIAFQPLFVFSFNHDRIGSFATGYISAFGIAIGPSIVIGNGGNPG